MHKTEHIRLHSSYSIVTDSSSIAVTEPTWHLKRVEDIPCSPSSSCYSSLYLEFGSKGSITWMNMVWTREHEYWEIHNIVLRSFWMQRLEQKSDAIKVWPSLHSAKQGRWLQTLGVFRSHPVNALKWKGILLIWSTKRSLFTKLFAWLGCKSRDASNEPT